MAVVDALPKSIRKPWQVWWDDAVPAQAFHDSQAREAFEALSEEHRCEYYAIFHMEAAAFFAWLISKAGTRASSSSALLDELRRRRGVWEEVEQAWDALSDEAKAAWVPADQDAFLANYAPEILEVASTIPTSNSTTAQAQAADACDDVAVEAAPHCQQSVRMCCTTTSNLLSSVAKPRKIACKKMRRAKTTRLGKDLMTWFQSLPQPVQVPAFTVLDDINSALSAQQAGETPELHWLLAQPESLQAEVFALFQDIDRSLERREIVSRKGIPRRVSSAVKPANIACKKIRGVKKAWSEEDFIEWFQSLPQPLQAPAFTILDEIKSAILAQQAGETPKLHWLAEQPESLQSEVFSLFGEVDSILN
eukprot:TRINITY_DN58841_c0_g1_i1.p1 TRINITY_DN58841_c0_g1~~TRINITY_DN58841_c0_g1_i1.p1  ORF type:complete len:382 (-),score=81.82 TRINITY_DN58841_c0_g1_i1:99-1190(-)